MAKFLSGKQFDGQSVALCSYWRNDFTTDVNQDVTPLISTGQTFVQKDKGLRTSIGSFDGQCIANAFFNRNDITCFNAGRCNEEGKCLSCTKYTYGGTRLAISHAPPVEILKSFNKGLTDADLRSPNLVAFPSSVVDLIDQDQLPYHILLRNIQAQISKCCHWNIGDGIADEFFLAKIIDGPDKVQFRNSKGALESLKGILIKNDTFPDKVGTFFPVGVTVVVGFKDQLSFYLEPRTGLFKPAEGVIIKTGQPGGITTKINNLFVGFDQLISDSITAAQNAQRTITAELNREQSLLNLANKTNDQLTIASAQTSFDEVQTRVTAINAAANVVGGLITSLETQLSQLDNTQPGPNTFAALKPLIITLNNLADELEIVAINSGGGFASETVSIQVSKLRSFNNQINFTSSGGVTKCEFAFTDENIAKKWNLPEDGSLICNGVRTDCDFYTGTEWEFATDEKMSAGQPITAEQLQEIRVRSDDFSRFDDPQKEFQNRFTTPFIWAFKGFANVLGQPRLKDMPLYRTKTLFNRDSSDPNFETILLNKTTVTNFDNFAITKQENRIQPGLNTININMAPQFPSIISKVVVPQNARLKVTHPRKEDQPFIYRTWSPDKNKISIFGTATPDSTVYLVNKTALQQRSKYNTFFKIPNFTKNLPIDLPDSPNFKGTIAFGLLNIFTKLEEEQNIGQSSIPLGFSRVGVDKKGTWQSISEVDLIHNTINDIFVFLLIDNIQFIFRHVSIDYHFLHSIVVQNTFLAQDATMQDSIGSPTLGITAQNIVNGSCISAGTKQIIGNGCETIKMDQVYFAYRFKDRGLDPKHPNAELALDLQTGIQFNNSDGSQIGAVVTEANSNAFITRVGYNVIQYSKTIKVGSNDWYVIDNCGTIMVRISDTDIHRVLPLPDQAGQQKALSDVLVIGGSKGSIIAQWAPTEITLSTKNGDKDLGVIFRDPDGIGLPANYVAVGVKPGFNEKNVFGAVKPGVDSITMEVTFLASQTAGLKTQDPQISMPELQSRVIKENFNDDKLFATENLIEQSNGKSFVLGSNKRPNEIQTDQQDYVVIFSDTENRPIGRKITRFMVLYYNLAANNVEMLYSWRGKCTSYLLLPDSDLIIGGDDGLIAVQPRGVTSTKGVATAVGLVSNSLLGVVDCGFQPSCGDHEFINLGGLRKEFEIQAPGEGGKLTAFFPSAGDKRPFDESKSIEFDPVTTFLIRRGPLWYPYDVCEQPRYNFTTGGPLHTDSTELINIQIKSPGL